jgi:hypothetical protein
MPIHTLFETVELSGEWWLPESLSRRISGTCKFTSQRVELRLHDSFNPVVGSFSAVDETPAIEAICGITTSGEAVTLLHATRGDFSINFGSSGLRQPATYLSSWLVLGAHVAPDTLYESARFEIPGLDTWLAEPTLLQSLMFDDREQLTAQRFDIRHNQKQTTLVPAIASAIDWAVSVRSESNTYSSVSLKAIGSTAFTPNEPKPLTWFIDQQSKLTSMLSFAAGCPMSIESISAKVADSSRRVQLLLAMRQGKPCTLKQPSDFFLPLPAAGTELQALAQNWYQAIDSVLAPSQLALSLLCSEGLWLHVKFASLMQALEGFHRARFPGNYMDPAAYESVKETIMNAIPASVATNHRDALKSRIRYGNQLSLARRMEDLRQLLGEALAGEVVGTADQIPRQWIDTRNYYAHWDEDLRDNCIDGQELHYATVRLENFLRILFLLLMGVPSDSILKALSGTSGTAQQLLQINLRDRHRLDPTQPAGVFMTICSVAADSSNKDCKPSHEDDAHGHGASEGNAEPRGQA